MNIDLIQATSSVALADVARRLNGEGISVIELQTGDPDFSTPSVIVEAASRALRDGHTHYSYGGGLPQLRDRLASALNTEFSASLERENILVTHGAAQGIAAIVSALVELGDEVIILEPNWTTLDSIVTLNGGRVIKVAHTSDDNRLLNQLEAARTHRTRMLCFNSPNNPTGSVFSADRIARLVDWARHHGLYVLSDEVYRSITFDVQHASVLEHMADSDRLLFVDSFSKRYAMTGWRVGFVVGHRDVMSRVAKSSQIMITNVAPFVQYGALAALESPETLNAAVGMRDAYRQRRDALLLSCEHEGLEVLYPDGAFYLFVRVVDDDVTFAKRLLDESRVCAVPGSAYGSSGAGWLRLTFAAPLEDVQEGIRRVTTLMRKLKAP
jgi:aspartate/methionine/tyrosine aminotransferase